MLSLENIFKLILIAALGLVGYESADANDSSKGSVLLAKRSKKSGKKKNSAKVRKRNLIRQKEYRGSRGRTTDLDFDDTGIDGQRQTPFGSGLTQAGSDKEASLINIRYHWQREMIQSTSRIRTGRR